MRTRIALRRALGLSAAVWLAGAAVALAHDPGLSSVEAALHADRLLVRLTLAPADVGLLLPPESDGDEAPRIDRLRGPLAVVARDAFDVSFEAGEVEPTDVRIQLEHGASNLLIDLDYPRPPAAGTLLLRSALFPRLPRGHRQHLTLRQAGGGLLVEALLDARDQEVAVALPALATADREPVAPARAPASLPPAEHTVHPLVLLAVALAGSCWLRGRTRRARSLLKAARRWRTR